MQSILHLHQLEKTLPHTEVKIVNGKNKVVEIGESGQLLTKGYDEVWMTTGIQSKMDQSGNIFLEKK